VGRVFPNFLRWLKSFGGFLRESSPLPYPLLRESFLMVLPIILSSFFYLPGIRPRLSLKIRPFWPRRCNRKRPFPPARESNTFRQVVRQPVHREVFPFSPRLLSMLLFRRSKPNVRGRGLSLLLCWRWGTFFFFPFCFPSCPRDFLFHRTVFCPGLSPVSLIFFLTTNQLPFSLVVPPLPLENVIVYSPFSQR